MRLVYVDHGSCGSFIDCVLFFKAALHDFFFIWSFGGRGTQHPTYCPFMKQFWQTATYFHIQQTQSTIMIP